MVTIIIAFVFLCYFFSKMKNPIVNNLTEQNEMQPTENTIDDIAKNVLSKKKLENYAISSLNAEIFNHKDKINGTT
ncbi:hypothetical protein AYI69_g1200 [Smittium culicis]|uniref:Uncharacterized protein n=1 Tax=Smittium culicis TaxID=133412 RepID=A0A1R1YQZ5_9FUNG|nr:hypothetical protein AYI69_g1200 [Smittium culicis]